MCLVLTWQNGQQTAHASQWLTQLVMSLLSKFGLQLDAGGTGANPAKPMKMTRRFLLAAVPLGLALVAEIPKEWIDGRHLTWSEAWLNVLGAGSGIAVAQLIASLHKRFKINNSD